MTSILKHFPGHGRATADTNLGVTDITHSYQREAELFPYRQLIADGYRASQRPGAIMIAHIINEDLDSASRPATISPDIITGLLRDEPGFHDVIVSDDMQMGAITAFTKDGGQADLVSAAILPGVDIILLSNQQGEYNLQNVRVVRDALARAVANSVIPEQHSRDSAQRVLALKRQRNLYNPATSIHHRPTIVVHSTRGLRRLERQYKTGSGHAESPNIETVPTKSVQHQYNS